MELSMQMMPEKVL